jgi:hypothetical protein
LSGGNGNDALDGDITDDTGGPAPDPNPNSDSCSGGNGSNAFYFCETTS